MSSRVSDDVGTAAGRRPLLVTVVLTASAFFPTLVAVAAGTAALDQGVPARPPTLTTPSAAPVVVGEPPFTAPSEVDEPNRGGSPGADSAGPEAAGGRSTDEQATDRTVVRRPMWLRTDPPGSTWPDRELASGRSRGPQHPASGTATRTAGSASNSTTTRAGAATTEPATTDPATTAMTASAAAATTTADEATTTADEATTGGQMTSSPWVSGPNSGGTTSDRTGPTTGPTISAAGSAA